ncbi:MAG: endonuclease/exonuclease/phosphatase family protein [Myxococcota bacterium]|nr:endonuclease/exonuclease/phosphatase family protein [Myxococcota bacterium]
MKNAFRAMVVFIAASFTASTAYGLGIEEFDNGSGGWDISPRKISRTSTPGWVTVERDGEVAITNSISPTIYSYSWKLTRKYDLGNTDAPVFDFKMEFQAGDYSTFEIQIGDENARRNSDFTTLYLTDFPVGITEDTIDLSEYEGEKVTIRMVLKKPKNVIVSGPGVYIYRAGIAFPERDFSADSNPDVLSLGAFNVQVFGKSKMRKDGVLENLVAILSRYDVVLFQEIRDSSGTAIAGLMDALNAATGNQYAIELSERLGRTSSKEQYAYIYKPSKVEVTTSYVFDDGAEPDNDAFEREPYVVHFSATQHDYDFTLVGIHTSPKHAFDEIDALFPVYQDAVAKLGDEDIILLGDLNASCNYVRQSRIDNLILRQDQRFTWHIDDYADTTTSNTKCAYDRFITSGTVTGRVDSEATQVFYFDQAYSLDQPTAKQVSDHYPVELRFQLAAE